MRFLVRVVFFLMLAGVLCGCASAATLEVGDGYTYATVNGALSAATSGDTILIYNTSTPYTEQITVTNINNLTIRGIGYPLIYYSAPAGNNNPCVLIGTNASDITIQGLRLKSDGVWMWYNGGVRAAGSLTWGINISDNIIESVHGNAVWFGGIGGDLMHPTNTANCANSRVVNNTILTTGSGRGIYINALPENLLVAYNDVSVSDDFANLGSITGDPYGMNVGGVNSTIKNNIVRCSAYSLLKAGGNNITVENNTIYGKAVHNCYETSTTHGGIFRNNTLIDTNVTWMNRGTAAHSLNNFYNPGAPADHHMIHENHHVNNSTTGRVFSIAGHGHHVLFKNTSIDIPMHLYEKLVVYGCSVSIPSDARTSNGLVVDNFTIVNHTGTSSIPMWIQGAGTDLTPTSHTIGNLSDLIRDNITYYDVSVQNNSYLQANAKFDGGTDTTADLGVYADTYDTNVSVILANSNLSIYYLRAGGGGNIVSSTEWFWFTDINITENGQPAGTSRIYIETNTSRVAYNETVPYYNGDYIDETQDNYTYQQTARGGLDSPEYIETLSNGQTGTRATPENCILLASSTQSLTDPTLTSSIFSREVYYNLTVSSGNFSTPQFYSVPNISDVVTIYSTGTYVHKYGTKGGNVTGFHPNRSQFKTNSYERGTVDLTIPITDYDATIIPMGVAM